MKSLSVLAVLSSVCFAAMAYAGDKAAPQLTPELTQKGKSVYLANCVTCHGDKADGNGDAGKYMSPKPRNLNTETFKKGDDLAAIFKSVTQGVDGTAMQGFPAISESDRWAVSAYCKSLRKH